MRIERRKTVLGYLAAALVATLSGCGPDNIKLQEAPPVTIEAAKKDEPTKDTAALKTGAPAIGSSGGIKHNPSETP